MARCEWCGVKSTVIKPVKDKKTGEPAKVCLQCKMFDSRVDRNMPGLHDEIDWEEDERIRRRERRRARREQMAE